MCQESRVFRGDESGRNETAILIAGMMALCAGSITL